jgi:hypothetical protein
MADSKLDKIKASYLELNESEKIRFNKFLEEQNSKRREELKKMREEFLSHIEKTGTMAKEYFKNLFQM